MGKSSCSAVLPQLQRLLQHEPGLGHAALEGVHQQQHAVHHLQYALHLAAEVGVARGVHDVDAHVPVADGGVLGEDGDAPLPLEIAAVHDAVHAHLAPAEDACVLQEMIHQGGLAVVYMGDDRNVSDFHCVSSKIVALVL